MNQPIRKRLFAGAAGTLALTLRRATTLTVRRTLVFTERRAAMTMLLVMMLTTAAAWAQDVTYLDENGTGHTCSTYTTMTDGSSSLTAGWYVVSNDVTIADRST